MDDILEEQATRADRLRIIFQKVGFTLWQLQALERDAAQYFVLITQAKQGMGIEAGLELTSKALKKTFGSTVNNLVKSKLLSNEIKTKFQAILAERNWLVHDSRASSRNAIHSEALFNNLVARLDSLAKQALFLHKEIEELVQLHVHNHGISQTQIEEMVTKTLQEWHNNDAL